MFYKSQSSIISIGPNICSAQSARGNLKTPLPLHVIVSLPADLPPSYSPRSSRGYQWISGISGLRCQEPGIQGQTWAAFTQLQSKGKCEGEKEIEHI